MPGTITVLEYNGSRYEDPFQGPINGLEGKSVTHSAALLEFSPSDISPNHLARLKVLHSAGKLDFKEHTNARGEKTYQLYYSFGLRKIGIRLATVVVWNQESMIR